MWGWQHPIVVVISLCVHLLLGATQYLSHELVLLLKLIVQQLVLCLLECDLFFELVNLVFELDVVVVDFFGPLLD